MFTVFKKYIFIFNSQVADLVQKRWSRTSKADVEKKLVKPICDEINLYDLFQSIGERIGKQASGNSFSIYKCVSNGPNF